MTIIRNFDNNGNNETIAMNSAIRAECKPIDNMKKAESITRIGQMRAQKVTNG
jgi:hypothetical protein